MRLSGRIFDLKYNQFMHHKSLILLCLLLSACTSLPFLQPTPTLSPEQIQSAALQTLTAVRATEKSFTNTPRPSATFTSIPSETPYLTATPTLSPTPILPTITLPGSPQPIIPTSFLQTQAALPCNKAEFVQDTSYPDRTYVTPGKVFIKTWRIKNVGSCTWTPNYKLVYQNGERFSAAYVTNIMTDVAPGKSADISIYLLAPTKLGEYTGTWRLQSPFGDQFGIGPADLPFSVQVVSSNTANVFAVTSVRSYASPKTYTGECPKEITLTGKITTNGQGTVEYHWIFSNGEKTEPDSIEFEKAQQITITETIEVGTPGKTYSGWAQIYIDQPNHQLFGQAIYSGTCNP
jgi:hypothetical protein